MGRRNYPPQQEPNVEPGELTKKIQFMESLANWEFTNDPDQVEFRDRWYFDQCAKYDVRPTVASLSLALNTSRQVLWTWEQKGGRLGGIISQAKRILNALLEDWSVCGKINPVSAVWLQKNHFHYRDTYTVEPMVRYDPAQPKMTADEIDKYLEDLDKRIPDYKAEEEQRQERLIAQVVPVDE